MTKKKKDWKQTQAELELRLKGVSSALEAIGELSKNLDKLGMFALGVYGSVGSPAQRLVGGIKGLVGYNLARSPNVVVGAAGLAITSATLLTAGAKTATKGGKAWYEPFLRQTKLIP